LITYTTQYTITSHFINKIWKVSSLEPLEIAKIVTGRTPKNPCELGGPTSTLILIGEVIYTSVQPPGSSDCLSYPHRLLSFLVVLEVDHLESVEEWRKNHWKEQQRAARIACLYSLCRIELTLPSFLERIPSRTNLKME
jgi:hypothetical protein